MPELIASLFWSLWFTFLAIFNRRFFDWYSFKNKNNSLYSYPRPNLSIKKTHKVSNLCLLLTTAFLAFMAFRNVYRFYVAILDLTNTSNPQWLITFIQVFNSYLVPIIYLTFVIIFVYLLIKTEGSFLLFMIPKAPISVINNSAQPLEVSVNKRLLGTIEPSRSLNNNFIPAYHPSYEVEAKDLNNVVVFSKVFSIDELDVIQGKIQIPIY